jgi:hypothetical protein
MENKSQEYLTGYQILIDAGETREQISRMSVSMVESIYENAVRKD